MVYDNHHSALFSNRSPPFCTIFSQITPVLHYILTDHPCSALLSHRLPYPALFSHRSPLSCTIFSQITLILHYFLTYHPCPALFSYRSPLSCTIFSHITPVLHYFLTDHPCPALFLQHVTHLLATLLYQFVGNFIRSIQPK